MSTNEDIIAGINAGGDRQSLMLDLWERNQGLIFSLVRRYEGYAEHDDLMQEAYIGFDDAVRHYDKGRGCLFSTVAVVWIKRRLSRFLLSCGNGVKISEHMAVKIRRYRKAVKDFERDAGAAPEFGEICDATGMSRESVLNLEAYISASETVSLDKPAGDGEGTNLGDMLKGCDDIGEAVTEKAYREQLKRDLWGAVETLPEELGEVLKLRYRDGMKLEAVADTEGITRSGAHARESHALNLMRTGRRGRLLLPYYEEIRSARRAEVFTLTDEDIRSEAMSSTGAEVFKHTFTSSTERAALKLASYNRTLI